MCPKPSAPYWESTSIRQNLQPCYPLSFLSLNSYNECNIEEFTDISPVFVLPVKTLITSCYAIQALEHISTLFVDRNLSSVRLSLVPPDGGIQNNHQLPRINLPTIPPLETNLCQTEQCRKFSHNKGMFAYEGVWQKHWLAFGGWWCCQLTELHGFSRLIINVSVDFSLAGAKHAMCANEEMRDRRWRKLSHPVLSPKSQHSP